MRKTLIAVLASLSLAPLAVAQEGEGEQEPPSAAQGLDVSKLPFTPDSVKMVIGEAQPRIQDCYEQMLAGLERPVEGKLMTHFTITSEGTVKSARVDTRASTIKNRKLNQCVALVLDGLVFPKPPNAKSYPVEFPFNLKAIK